MQTDSLPKKPKPWRFILGWIVGAGITLVVSIFSRPNIIVAALVILLATEIANVSSPKHNGIMGALIGVVEGVYIGIFNFYQIFGKYEESNIFKILIFSIIVGLMRGIIFGAFGYVLGRIMKSFRESKGFFLITPKKSVL